MRKRILTLGIVGTALIVGGVAYHFGFFSRPRPNVILIVLDTFRADRLAAHGNTRGLTPFLDQWAAKSTVYERAYAASSWTAPSVATLLLAQYPSEHQLIRMTSVLPDRERTLAEVLRDNGFRTGGFSGNMQISPKTGFGQGFDTFKLLLSSSTPNGDAQQLNQAALQWLAQRGKDDRPFFLYVQYMDTHSPYREHPALTAPRAPALQASDADLNERLTDGSVAAAFGSHDPWHFDPTETQRLSDLYDGEVQSRTTAWQSSLAASNSRGCCVARWSSSQRTTVSSSASTDCLVTGCPSTSRPSTSR
jgi:arylsulfatase A-like enzyme